MKRLMIFFFITVFFESTFGQTHSIGFRIEPFLFIGKSDAYINLPHLNRKSENEFKISVSSFYLTYSYKALNSIAVESRIGYLWTSPDVYNGAELGVFVKYFLNDRAYLLTGVNIHNNEGYQIEPNYYIKSKMISFAVIATGLKFSNGIGAELQYNLPLSREYKTQIYEFDPVINIPYNIAAIIKLSFGVEFSL